MTVDQRPDAGKSTAAEIDLVPTFGQALTSDLEGVRRLEVETYGDDAYSYVVLRQFIDMSGEFVQVCKDANGNVIAYGIIARSVSQDSGWFLSLVVSLPHRRKGIGATLARRLLAKADSYSCEKIFLTVAPDNNAAISLYKRLGFTFVEKFEHYYGRNEDRILMCRS
jgi:[ribosomal protein S18]-alanine N-acetyltransferase